MAQVIGELSQSWLNRAVKAPLEDANNKREQADKLEQSNPAQAARLRSEAQAIEAEYGIGSNLQLGVRAATAALQGLATGDVNQAAVGALSPYLNRAIKQATTNADGSVNTEANAIAHTVLGVLEAKATGNNALAGGLGALTAELAAPLVMKQLYGTDNPAQLSEHQKRNVATISAITAGLAGGLAGDSTASGIAGAETGKRAVENNYLSVFSDNRKHWLKKQLERTDLSNIQREEYEREFIHLEQDDHTSDILVKKALNTPSEMTKKDWELYNNYITRYYLESIAVSEKPNDIQSNLNSILSDNHIKGYSYPYATVDKYRQYLPNRWDMFGTEKFNDEVFYKEINSKVNNQKIYEESFNGRVAKSTAEALGYASIAMPLSSVYANLPKVGAFVSKYPTITESGIIATTNTAVQLLDKKEPYTFSSLVEAELSYFLTRKNSASVAWSKNMMLGGFMEQAEKQEKEMRYGIKSDPDFLKKALSISIGGLGSKGIDYGFKKVNTPYSENLMKPIMNSIVGESSPKVIDELDDKLGELNKGK